jgi:xanthine dehydrogenase accessory factor
MLVSATDCSGTIGGGELEYQSTRIAVRLLADKEKQGFLRRFPLGSNCGQCCGGVVDVLFQKLDSMPSFAALFDAWQQRRACAWLTGLDDDGVPRNALLDEHGRLSTPLPAGDTGIEAATDLLAAGAAAARLDTPGRGGRFLLVEPVCGQQLEVAVFGAGHVGSALVQILSGLAARIRWIDTRRDMFPQNVPGNVQVIEATDPAREVNALPASAFFLVMTHSHALDFAITAAILRRADAAYCGLIGSLPKRRRFESRLKAQGFADSDLQKLVCPIGIGGINSKEPQAIAIAVSADLLRRHERLQSSTRPRHNPARVQMLRA